MFHSIFCLNDLSILLDHNYTHIFICSPVHPKQNREPYRTPPTPSRPFLWTGIPTRQNQMQAGQWDKARGAGVWPAAT